MSDTNEGPGRAARLSLRPLLIVAGVYHLGLGLFQFAAPRQFYDAVATFPPYNAHFLRDVASIFLATGIVLLIAAARRSWQVPVLSLVVIQYAIHVIAHIVDFGKADTTGVASASLVSLAIIGLILFWLLRVAGAEEAR